ncbi:11136_t:CDS:2, partial [Ambispora gerdemannii]
MSQQDSVKARVVFVTCPETVAKKLSKDKYVRELADYLNKNHGHEVPGVISIKPKGSSIELPGPTPLPIIGNIHQLGVGRSMHQNFTKMSKSFGPIFKVRLGQITWIIINDHMIAKDLFISRGSTFSSRPEFGLFTDIILHGSKSVAFCPNYSWWKTMRLLESQAIRPHLVENVYFPVICDNVKRFIQQLYLKSLGDNISQNPTADIKLLITKILATIVFGDLAKDSTVLERYSHLSKEIIEFTDIKSNLLSVFGWLKYFGIRKFLEREARQLTAKRDEFSNGLLQQVKNRMIENGPDSETCVSAELLKSVIIDPSFVASPHTHEFKKDENGKYIFDNYDVLQICNDLMIGGTSTTSGSLYWIFATLANYPKVQRKIQQELDRIVGKGKFYVMDHHADLHYLKATIKESLRF